MPRIAPLRRNFRNPATTSNPTDLQANLLLVGVWRVKTPDNNLYANIHCYLLLTLASYHPEIISAYNSTVCLKFGPLVKEFQMILLVQILVLVQIIVEVCLYTDAQ